MDVLGARLLKRVESGADSDESLPDWLRCYAQLQNAHIRTVNLQLEGVRMVRETGRIFLKYYSDQRAREIAEAGFDNTEKIERLGELLFGDLWSGISPEPVDGSPRPDSSGVFSEEELKPENVDEAG